MTVPWLLAYLATGRLKGFQSELDNFFGRLGNRPGLVCEVSKSPFSRARKQLNSPAFKVIGSRLPERRFKSIDLPRRHSLRLVAGDLTCLRPPNLPGTLGEFRLHPGGAA